MALLKKTLNNLAEKCGCGDDENSGTALLSFLVRRNQAEEEEQLDAVRMVGDKKPDTDMDDAVDVDGEEREYHDDESGMGDEMDPDAEGEMDMEIDPDLDDEEMDPDAEGEMDMDMDMDMGGEEPSEADIENEQDPEKRLSMIQSLLSKG